MPNIHQNNMCPLLVVRPHHVVGEKRFPASRWAKDKFIPVRTDASFHWLIGNINMHGFAREAISHADTNWADGRLIACFQIEKASSLIDERIEGVVHGKVGFVAWKPCPKYLWCPVCFLPCNGIHLVRICKRQRGVWKSINDIPNLPCN